MGNVEGGYDDLHRERLGERLVHLLVLLVGLGGQTVAKRGESGDLGGLWLKESGLAVGSEVLHRFSRVRRAAPSLQIKAAEPVVASYGLTKTATLTMLVRLALLLLDERVHHRRHLLRLPHRAAPHGVRPSLPALATGSRRRAASLVQGAASL